MLINLHTNRIARSEGVLRTDDADDYDLLRFISKNQKDSAKNHDLFHAVFTSRFKLQ